MQDERNRIASELGRDDLPAARRQELTSRMAAADEEIGTLRRQVDDFRLTDPEGFGMSRRRITVSTSGLVPAIEKLSREPALPRLAVSLNATTDAVRDRLMPVNRKYPIAELLEACRTYPGVSNARRITFEYVMLKGVNDSIAEAKELVRLLARIPAKINLIPFNPWPGAPYECSDDAAIDAFAKIIWNAGYSSPVRTPRGRDIMAACGQLKSESLRQRKARRPAGA